MQLPPADRERIEAEEKLRHEIQQRQQLEAKAAENKKTAQGCLGCLGAIVVVSAGLGLWSAISPEDPERKAQREFRNVAAIVATRCEFAVKDRLKSPGSADFPFALAASVVASGTNTYLLASYVDAQNGFGAFVRTRFACSVTGTGTELAGYRVTDVTLAPD